MDIGILREGDFHQGFMFFLAQDDADGGVLRLGFHIAVKVVDVHLHLAQVLVRELADLEVNQHVATQQPVVKHQVQKKVVVIKEIRKVLPATGSNLAGLLAILAAAGLIAFGIKKVYDRKLAK